jgi:hypothetical protein
MRIRQIYERLMCLMRVMLRGVRGRTTRTHARMEGIAYA